jgi:hypothetical protein
MAWDGGTDIELSLVGDVRVGVFAQHNTTERFVVEFDKYSLTQQGK